VKRNPIFDHGFDPYTNSFISNKGVSSTGIKQYEVCQNYQFLIDTILLSTHFHGMKCSFLPSTGMLELFLSEA